MPINLSIEYPKLQNELTKLKYKYENVVKLLEELTPGGSEFYNDPEYCAKWVKEQINSIPSQILPFKNKNDKLIEQNKELLKIFKEVTNEYEVALKLLCEAGKFTYFENNLMQQAKAAIQKASQL